MRILLSETTWSASAIAAELERTGYLVTRADDGQTVIDYAGLSQEDAILLDADLPDLGALACLRELRSRRPQTAILVLTGRNEDTLRLAALMAGADDALCRDAQPREIAARIGAIARRRAGFPAAPVLAGGIELDLFGRTAQVGGQPVRLSRLEFALVEFLALRAGSVMSDDDIMTHLYGLDDTPEDGIVKVFVSHIRRKIEVAGGDPAALTTVWGRGYRLEMESAPARTEQAAPAAERAPNVAEARRKAA
jgi:DNA-binding response OmpR family regulator